MKRIGFFLLFIPFIVQAQNWQNICSRGKMVYINKDSNFAALRLDTVQFQAGDSVYFSYFAFRDTSSNYQNPQCVDTTEGSIFGRRIIRHPDGNFNFFNRNNDTIILKTTYSLNQAWKMIGLPGNGYLEAKVTGIAFETFLGISDSVKTILLQAKDNLGNPVSHAMNNKLIRLSKSYGLISFYDAYFFPDDTTSYQLAGNSDPFIGFQDPVADEIYNWPAGSVFHYKDDGGYTSVDNNITKSEMKPPHFSYHSYTIKKILQKTVTPDSIVYTCHICSLSTSGYFGYEDTTIINNTVTEVYNFNAEGNYLNKLQDEFNPSGHLYDLKICQVNNAPAKSVNENYFSRISCWYDFPYPPDFVLKTFAKNLGMTAKRTLVFYGNPSLATYYNLVYFSCDTLTWGTPLYADCDALLAINPNKTNLSPAIRIMPDPVERTAIIEIPGDFQRNQLAFCLFDTMGRKLMCRQVSDHSFLFDREGFASGLYFYSLTDREGKILTSGKVMIR